MKESIYNIWHCKGDVRYLYNGVTGALLRTRASDQSDLADFLKNGAAADCSPELLVRLAEGGMIVDDEIDEVSILADRYQKSRKRTDVFGLTIVTSLGCNFDCPYCYQKKHPQILGSDVRSNLLKLVDSRLDKASAFSVTWFGGEPLVGKKPLYLLSEAFIERCSAANVRYSADIVTNGYMLDGKVAAELREFHVGRAQITLDGPADLHNEKRPLVNGNPTYRRIVDNLSAACEHLDISVRVNVDTENVEGFERLLEDLRSCGLSGRVGVYAAQIVSISMNSSSPSASYGPRCFTKSEFAETELGLNQMACDYGFSTPTLPKPTGAPCTAVRDHELVIGSGGELYKCWYDVGNPGEVIGNIADYGNLNGRVRRWLAYDPFANPDCRSCIALPVCMGGCAAHALDINSYDDRCGTFRHAYHEQIDALIESAQTVGPSK